MRQTLKSIWKLFWWLWMALWTYSKTTTQHILYMKTVFLLYLLFLCLSILYFSLNCILKSFIRYKQGSSIYQRYNMLSTMISTRSFRDIWLQLATNPHKIFFQDPSQNVGNNNAECHMATVWWDRMTTGVLST